MTKKVGMKEYAYTWMITTTADVNLEHFALFGHSINDFMETLF